MFTKETVSVAPVAPTTVLLVETEAVVKVAAVNPDSVVVEY